MTIKLNSGAYVVDRPNTWSYGLSLIKYNSTWQGTARNMALLVPITNVQYYYSRRCSADVPPTYVYINEEVFGYLVVDIDTGKVIDIYEYNWYYTSSWSNHYNSINKIYVTYGS